MLKQLSLWPTEKKSTPTLEIWQTLDHEQQQQITTALAHLIRKIVCPKKEKQTKGTSDEQQ